ncbi:hypothetical protein K438DRAFT_1961095 [Mycena galopus ATCC 62051]|nr:hypothetical protein K438DRAFT_1961095 [Mycena galopus ATCC 62051]
MLRMIQSGCQRAPFAALRALGNRAFFSSVGKLQTPHRIPCPVLKNDPAALLFGTEGVENSGERGVSASGSGGFGGIVGENGRTGMGPMFGGTSFGRVRPSSFTVSREPGALGFIDIPCEDDEPVTECPLFPGSKEVVMNVPGFPRSLVQPAAPAFRLGSAPGKGLGVFSTRALNAGDLLSEGPLLISARGLYVSPVPNYTQEMFMQHSMDHFEKYLAVGRMRPENKAAFMSLANSHTNDGWPLRRCSSNTSAHFDLSSFSYSLYAACTDPGSDARRAAIEQSTGNLLQWAMIDRSLPADWMIKKSLQQLVFLTAENMQHSAGYSDATQAIMEAYICLGDTQNASK